MSTPYKKSFQAFLLVQITIATGEEHFCPLAHPAASSPSPLRTICHKCYKFEKVLKQPHLALHRSLRAFHNRVFTGERRLVRVGGLKKRQFAILFLPVHINNSRIHIRLESNNSWCPYMYRKLFVQYNKRLFSCLLRQLSMCKVVFRQGTRIKKKWFVVPIKHIDCFPCNQENRNDESS